ncbi:DUF1566 domain-containing protein, partial [Janthinobacterium sp.]|uniref:Lcl domain-containing protein n=1 Tax=Janthinobacterium sp. TaxID=1871054 RepID=UPI00293D8AF8
AAGSMLAAAALALTIEGFADWYIPSRDELELVYRHFKPADEENYADGLDGVNASSTPAGAAYTEAAPGQTDVETFKAGGADAMDDYWHWSSTQSAPDPSHAWFQGFDGGYQFYDFTSYAGRARAVRRLIIQ